MIPAELHFISVLVTPPEGQVIMATEANDKRCSELALSALLSPGDCKP